MADALVGSFRFDCCRYGLLEGEAVGERKNFDHLAREIQGGLLLRIYFPFNSTSTSIPLQFRAENFRLTHERLRRLPEFLDFARSGMANPLVFQELNDATVLAAIGAGEPFYVLDLLQAPEHFGNTHDKFSKRKDCRLHQLGIGRKVSFVVSEADQTESEQVGLGVKR